MEDDKEGKLYGGQKELKSAKIFVLFKERI